LRAATGRRGNPDLCRVGPRTSTGALSDYAARRLKVADYQINEKRSLTHVERRVRLHLEPFFGGRRMAAITTAVSWPF